MFWAVARRPVHVREDAHNTPERLRLVVSFTCITPILREYHQLFMTRHAWARRLIRVLLLGFVARLTPSQLGTTELLKQGTGAGICRVARCYLGYAYRCFQVCLLGRVWSSL